MVNIPILSDMYDKVVAIYNWMKSIYDFIQSIPEGIIDVMKKVVAFVEDVPGTLYSWFSTAMSWVYEHMMDLIHWFGSSFNWMVSQIPGPYMIVAPILLIAILGFGYLLVRIVFWAYHQIPVIG